MTFRPLALVLIAAPALAGPAPLILSHQGMLRDGSDSPVNGEVHMKFGLYKNSRPPDAGGEDTFYWESNEMSVTAYNGFYSALLGQGPSGAIPANAFEGAGDRWLGVSVEGQKLVPRTLVTSAPWALTANLAAEADHAAEASHAVSAGAADDAAKLGAQLPAFYQNAGNLNAGTLPSDRLSGSYAQQLAFNNAANTYNGNGAGLTSVDAVSLDGEAPAFYRNATNLDAGTLPSDRLSGTYSGTLAFSNAASTFAGTAANATNAANAANAADSAMLGTQPPAYYRNASNLNAGTLPSDRLSGTYSQSLNLSNTSNTLKGNGAGVTGVDAALLEGNNVSQVVAAAAGACYQVWGKRTCAAGYAPVYTGYAATAMGHSDVGSWQTPGGLICLHDDAYNLPWPNDATSYYFYIMRMHESWYTGASSGTRNGAYINGGADMKTASGCAVCCK